MIAIGCGLWLALRLRAKGMKADKARLIQAHLAVAAEHAIEAVLALATGIERAEITVIVQCAFIAEGGKVRALILQTAGLFINGIERSKKIFLAELAG